MSNKVVTGTKDNKKVHVIKGQDDVRQLRCTRCRSGLTVAVPDGKGGTVQRCGNCGTSYLTTRL